MSIPDFQSLLRLVLQIIANGVTNAGEIRKEAAAQSKLSQEELAQKGPRGRQTLFANHVAFSFVHLQFAGFIGKKGTQSYEITETGLRALREGPPQFDLRYLQQQPGYR
jgi:restriction system protein